MACLATVVKMCVLLLAYLEFLEGDHELSEISLGLIAIVLPLLAAGMLSWAASMDLEALVHTYEETLDFLDRQLLLLEQVKSRSEFDKLVVETEARLLGETLSWYYRRSFTGVT